MKWKNIKIFYKLIIYSSPLILFAILLGLVGTQRMNKINKQTNKLDIVYIPVVNASINAYKNWTKLVVNLENYNHSSDSFYSDKVLVFKNRTVDDIADMLTFNDKSLFAENYINSVKDIDNKIKKFNNIFNTYKSKVDTLSYLHNKMYSAYYKINDSKSRNVSQAVLSEIENYTVSKVNVRELQKLLSKINVLSSKYSGLNDFSAKSKAYISYYIKVSEYYLKVRESAVDVKGDLNVISDIIFQAFNGVSENIHSITSAGKKNLFYFFVLFLFASLTFTYFISRSITNPIIKIVRYAKSIAEGDISQKPNIDRKDEIGEIIISLESIASNLNSIVSKIRHSNYNIREIATFLEYNSQRLASGASKQADSAALITDSMQEIVDGIHKSFENTNKSKELAANAANMSNTAVSFTYEAIALIDEISKKIRVIDEFAYKTNLLAVNAAIEASKVGNKGKGFVVIAEEIRKLADHSRKSAIDIQKLTAKTVEVSEKAGTTINEVSEEINKTSQYISEVASYVKEQSNSVEVVNNSVVDLNDIIKQNSADADKLAEKAKYLTNHVDTLKKLIDYFK